MCDGGILDNDVLIKICGYRIADDVLLAFQCIGPLATLAVTRIIVRKQIRRSSRIVNKAAAEGELDALLEQLQSIEPTQEEVDLAAEFEEAALAQNLPFDTGESQILAVIVFRATMLMLTGDKRAIIAAGPLLAACNRPDACDGRIVCFEQIIWAILRHRSTSDLQSHLCCEPALDKTVAIVFRCSFSGQPVVQAAVEEGLRSYIGNLRASAPKVLFQEDRLSVTT
jgi:hypothetical protein